MALGIETLLSATLQEWVCEENIKEFLLHRDSTVVGMKVISS